MIKKWRDLSIDPFDIIFKNVKINNIVSYPYAGNDVIECDGVINDKEENMFIKIERSKVSDLENEVYVLNTLYNNNYYTKIPKVYEYGSYNNKKYIVLEKKNGNRLSEIINKENKELLLKKYGKELANIHKIDKFMFKKALERDINFIPIDSDDNIIKYINYLKSNIPNFEYNTFIHGDFHYGNILWNNNIVSSVLDFEYSGIGVKEQDIAWVCILRPNQKFMDSIHDIKMFLSGYLEEGNFNIQIFKWCLINGYCHFYLMNKNNKLYIKKILILLESVYNFNI